MTKKEFQVATGLEIRKGGWLSIGWFTIYLPTGERYADLFREYSASCGVSGNFGHEKGYMVWRIVSDHGFPFSVDTTQMWDKKQSEVLKYFASEYLRHKEKKHEP